MSGRRLSRRPLPWPQLLAAEGFRAPKAARQDPRRCRSGSRRTVARPLQFGRYHWNITADGEGYQGGGAFVRSRDLLKIGQLYLDDGVWNGKRIVSAEWVALSTAPHMQITPATTGLSAEEFANNYWLAADGYTWHVHELHSGGAPIRSMRRAATAVSYSSLCPKRSSRSSSPPATICREESGAAGATRWLRKRSWAPCRGGVGSHVAKPDGDAARFVARDRFDSLFSKPGVLRL